MSRSPIHRSLKRVVQRALRGYRVPRVTTRRRFLGELALGTAALTAMGCGLWRPSARPAPRIAVVGGGMAGLYAAWLLQKAGMAPRVFEGSNRLGGRIWSQLPKGPGAVVLELGGEFIDSNHEDILFLAEHFGLRLLDGESPGEEALSGAWFFSGRHVGDDELLAGFLPLLPRLRADVASLADEIGYRNPRGGGPFDGMTLTEYLDRIGATGVIRQFIDVAYVTEFGLEADEQSALNLLLLIGTESEREVEIFGDSDERYRVEGGNQQIIDRLEAELLRPVEMGQRLVAIKGEHGRGYRLAFESDGGIIREEAAELVLLTIPFSTLREVEIQVPLPEVKRRAIAGLAMGNSAKLILPTQSRAWRNAGLSGEAFSDESFQCAWDGSQLQATTAGAITIYTGGQNGIELGRGSVQDQMVRLMPGLDRALAGTLEPVHAAGAVRMHWPSLPWSRGGYACYRPGQYGEFSGAEAEPVGGIYFAGEHCSFEFQGYMNGAAESARLAVDAMISRI